jgi:hypothetical protein
MNTFVKYAPTVFVVSCKEQKSRGDIVLVATKYGKEVECEIFNFVGVWRRDSSYLHSYTRTDGVNSQERARRKAERIRGWAESQEGKSLSAYEKSREHAEFLKLGEPIKIGHHSEKRHRKLFEDAHNNMRKSVEAKEKAKAHAYRADYWDKQAGKVDLSMPESLEFYAMQLQAAKMEHEGLKDGSLEREHSYSLTYAKKRVNDISKKLDLAQKLWG